MKKKILFVIPSLRSGGAEKSLVSLLSLFDYEKYEVDLLLFRRDGLFIDKIPNEINYIYDTTDYEIFDGDGKNAIKYFFKKCKFRFVINRIKYTRAFDENDENLREKKLWELIKKVLPKITKKYDCAIGYLEGFSNCFVTELNGVDKKICYIHNDIGKLPHNEELYRETLEKAGSIVTVSDVCKESLIKEFPEFSEKINVIENITSRKFIQQDLDDEAVYHKKDTETIILTVGRCSEQKNIELAVKTCEELKRRGRKIRWYHIGKGEMFEEIQNLVYSLNLEDDFIMLGERSNPYPYMAQCDIYVQPSRYEGKSIAIDEVKCLCRPIVVTDFPSVSDQIQDGVNGLICQMNVDDMADKIEKLIDDKMLCEKLCDNLKNEKIGNEEEIEKLYELIEN